MIEIMNSQTELFEADVLAQTRTSFAALKDEIETDNIDLKEKPIDLGYKEINKEKKIVIDLPDQYSAQGRILRCLRRKSATDAVEDKYGIPRGLLLAMMAQEGMGDPLMPNLSGDGGLGLIHIQAVNAADFGLDTLPRHTTGMQDFKHGKEIVVAKKEYNDDLKQLIDVDDRFHPIMGLDCSARFLKNVYNSTEAGKDKWINALRKYSGRALNDYLRPVVKYRVLINQYTGDKMPDFSVNTNKEITKMKTAGSVTLDEKSVDLDIASIASKKLSITIDGKAATYEQYLTYFGGQVQNYGLKEYITSKPKTKTTKKTETKDLADGIDNLEYLNKSKDKLWNIYKYTLPLDNPVADPVEFLNLVKARKKFTGKTIKLTDENGFALDPLNFPNKKGDAVYIKEKI